MSERYLVLYQYLKNNRLDSDIEAPGTVQREETTMKCQCPCHESGGVCSICASIEGGTGKGSFDPVEMGAIM